jgi:luciferase family oxidoreductase group 1
MHFKTPRLSMLDLVAVREGGTVRQALDIAVQTAQKAEALGFARYWLAEHHNMPGIASSATAVLIGHIAGQTTRIRVGSGGIMLPNHPPTMRALRRDRVETEEDFPRDVAELQRLLGPADPNARISATPGTDTHIPIWLLGSSLYSAQLAAMKGLPYAFASHFAPRFLHQAIGLYRQLFRPSAVLDKPYVMVGVPVVAAPTDAEAQFLATSTQQRVLGILTGQRGKLPLPVEGFLQQLGPREQAAIQDFLALAVVGGPETVRQGFAQIQQSTEADELILVTDIHDPALRLRSLEISAQALAG